MKRNERRVPYSSAKALACAFSTFAVLALALTGCAPKANDAVVTGEDEAAAVQVDFTWSETGDCSMCHAKEQRRSKTVPVRYLGTRTWLALSAMPM